MLLMFQTRIPKITIGKYQTLDLYKKKMQIVFENKLF